MTSEEVKQSHRLEAHISAGGAKLHGSGTKLTTNRCAMLEHKPAHQCVTVDIDKQLWNCNDCGRGGDIITWIAIQTGKSAGEVLRELGGGGVATQWRPSSSRTDYEASGATPTLEPEDAAPTEEPLKYEQAATYDYNTATGSLAYQVVRLHAQCPSKPAGYAKTFRQRHPDGKGGWIHSMDGVERVLYRLPEVLAAKTVWVTEGEKDADNLAKHGFSATCNVGGAGKWMDGYTESLAKRNVALCGDNDDAGQKHVKSVFDSLAGKAKTVRIIQIPKQYKDVSDYIASFKTELDAKHALYALFDAAVPFVKGVGLPIYRVAELEDLYRRHVERMAHSAFNLSSWIPGLHRIRSLVPGELVLFLGATGIGKTAILSNIAKIAWPLPTVFFELELPSELMYERLLALKTGMSCIDVEKAYQTGDSLGEKAIDQKLSHLYICTQSRLTTSDIESITVRSELKIGERPRLVLVDYIGLMHGVGKSRYERVSQAMEDLKVIAKVTQTVIIVASQVNRTVNAENPEITLESGKDSGSLENSAGLVIGAWREDNQTDTTGTIILRVLKSTKGGAGTEVTCNYNLGTLGITER